MMKNDGYAKRQCKRKENRPSTMGVTTDLRVGSYNGHDP